MTRIAALCALFGYAAAMAAQLHCPMAGMELHGHASQHLADVAAHASHPAHQPTSHDHESPAADCWMSAGCLATTGVVLVEVDAVPLGPVDREIVVRRLQPAGSTPPTTDPPPPRSV